MSKPAKVLQVLLRLPAFALIGLIRCYQMVVSPLLPVISPQCGCRFSPSCSHYALESLRLHGAVFGSWLAARRLLKCTPLHPGGFDPVPALSQPDSPPTSRPLLPCAPRCTRVNS